MRLIYSSDNYQIKEYGTDPVLVIEDRATKEIVVAEGIAASMCREVLDMTVTDNFVDTMCKGVFDGAKRERQ